MNKYVIFFDPVTGRNEIDTVQNFKEIRFNASWSGEFKFSDFIIRHERYCSKHTLKKFEKKKNEMNKLLN